MEDAELRARQAAELLRNDLLKEVLKKLEERAIKKWQSSPDPNLRNDAWYEQRLAKQFAIELIALIEKPEYEKKTNARRKQPNAG